MNYVNENIDYENLKLTNSNLLLSEFEAITSTYLNLVEVINKINLIFGEKIMRPVYRNTNFDICSSIRRFWTDDMNCHCEGESG